MSPGRYWLLRHADLPDVVCLLTGDEAVKLWDAGLLAPQMETMPVTFVALEQFLSMQREREAA